MKDTRREEGVRQTGETGRANAITEGVIWKQLLLFFFPILFGTFFQQLYNTADAVVVGRFVGKEALAAVGGSTSMLTNLLVGFFVGLSSGATVIIAQFYGAGRGQRVSEAVHTAIAFSLLCGILMTVGGLLFSDTALRLMGTPEDIMDNASGYLHIYFVGITANLLYNMGAGILRAIGDSKRPFYFLVISCFTNIALDLLFVVGLRMGVRGAAVATILSQVVSACLVLGTLMRADGSYRFEIRKTRITPVILVRIIRIGFPAGLQSVMYSFSNLVIQSSVNALGTDGIVINFTGFDLNSLLQDEEKTAAETARQGAFFNLLTEWKAAHAGKEIVFKGSPQNVIGKEILVESKYIIVNAHSAKNLYEMSYLVLMASAKGVPTDRFIIGVTTPYLSNMGDQYGMVNGRSAIVAAAEWTLQEVPDYIKAGISVDGVEQDYFNPTKIYPNVREAINILSPTAK